MYALNGTFGFLLPKSDVKINPSIEMNKKELKVTKFPHPGSTFANNSREITFKQHPTNTVNIASLTRRLEPPIVFCQPNFEVN